MIIFVISLKKSYHLLEKLIIHFQRKHYQQLKLQIINELFI
ncbi:MAG: hypothetical protein GBAus27B_000365 [Mycoplasmataceae bacterium]|nr:MAG: hypothetical protein GBAus27B_000365 [Mycoplasmataceae bacterium]